MYQFIQTLPLEYNLLLFLIFTAGIWWAGTRLTIIADFISERHKLARTTIGLVLLASATSLPEIATTVSGSIIGNPDLVLNNLFGGIALQTTILAVADFWARGAITNYPRKASSALEATLLVTLLVCLQIIILLGEPIAIYGVGLGSITIAILYISALVLLRRYETNNDWIPIDLPELSEPSSFKFGVAQKIRDTKLHKTYLLTAFTCGCILFFGVGIVMLSEKIALQTGLGSSFVGVTFLAAATSLPELATTIAAVRLGAYTLAISNIFGSNLIMLVLVLPADTLDRSGPILKHTSHTLELAVALGLLTTTIYLVGLIVRRKINIAGFGIDSLLVILTYFSGLIIFYFIK
ncbi:sodium:calcium antiporter [Amylibacter sp. SFDW26]|uniref:sodium:calcium antiporter n=1 Tax=Amylibacter sp. SFDW26 TaxID=2652722 RepID=UPI0012620120|nr:sodium:calcium antiporter [Amylibacter sp. SFDW26]KAB7614440.1 sodium:calcium antiporter [Amylibacter sp. SFDW26]